MTKLDPIVSEFETEEEAEAYDRWFREKVARALKNKGPGIPHDEVFRRLEEKLDSKRSDASGLD